jgi:gamma-glutamyl:cysteine ligase YbdK (ATP-grasp superfamily)
MIDRTAPLALWAGTGVELEYMIVDSDTLEVRPIADLLFREVRGTLESEADDGRIAWSNELVLHIIELKTNGPVADLTGLGSLFHDRICEINRCLTAFGAKLMPSAMHPWMDPAVETRLWPHDHAEIYQAYDRIFGCHSHGYANLQSMHLNLSFANDDEFGRLHAATRVLLPLVPAIAASSPFALGQHPGWLDYRLEVYRHNADRIPSITGSVIPEPVFTRADYQREILDVIYRDIGPFDPQGQLRDEFLNARGAIARFNRGSIELRLIDVQECPKADLALARLVVAILRLLANEYWSSMEDLRAAETEALKDLLCETARHAEAALIFDADLLHLLGWCGQIPCSGQMLWQHLIKTAREASAFDADDAAMLDHVLRQGPLARRLLRAAGLNPSRDRLRSVYRHLCDCLAEDQPFDAKTFAVGAWPGPRF